MMEHGHAFFAPHLLYPQILDDRIAIDRASGIGMGLALLERCDELWAFGGHVSAGMQLEIARAAGLGIPVKTVPALDREPQILAFPSNSEQESGQQL